MLDAPDLVYKDMNAKFNAVVNEVIERHKKGQPVLLGTVAVETSEYISQLLKRKGIPHNVLNAKNHEREAEIIMDAGEQRSCNNCDEYGRSWNRYQVNR